MANCVIYSYGHVAFTMRDDSYVGITYFYTDHVHEIFVQRRKTVYTCTTDTGERSTPPLVLRGPWHAMVDYIHNEPYTNLCFFSDLNGIIDKKDVIL